MARKIISNCNLIFHDIKSVSFQVSESLYGSELLTIYFKNGDGDSGRIDLFFKAAVEIKQTKILLKLKKILVDLGGIKLRTRRKNGKK